MILEQTERLLEIESEINERLKKLIKDIIEDIKFEFEQLRSKEKINIELMYDKYDNVMFELKISGILEKWKLNKYSEKKIIWQRIKFLLEHSLYSDEYKKLSEKKILNQEEREKLKRIVNYMRDSYALLRFILSRL